MNINREQSSGERSGLGVLFAVLAFGIVLIVSPLVGLWLFRAAIILYALLVFACIIWVRNETRELPRPGVTVLGFTVGLVLLGIWAWYVARGIADGRWVDTALRAVVAAETGYVMWLASRWRRAG